MGQVGRVWVDIGANASELKRAVSESKQALNSLASNASTAGAETGTSLLEIASKAAIAVGAIMMAIQTAKKVYDFAEEGAKIASLELSSKKLAASYNTNMASIVNAVQAASFNTITEFDAMKAANLALTMGISTNANEIASLMEIAIERGRAFGLTTEEAFDRITRGIGRRSTKILDDLGFTANATAANKAYADSLGIATSALTDDMKVRALFEQILTEGNAELAKQGGLMMDISTPYQRVGTKIKQIFADAQKTMSHIIAPLITSSEDLFNIEREEAAVAILSGTYWQYSVAMKRAANTQRDYFGWLDANKLTLGQFADAQRLTAQAIAYQNDELETTAVLHSKFGYSLQELIGEESVAIGLSGEIATAQEKYALALDAAGGSTKKQAIALNELNESYEDFILSTMQKLGFDPEATFRVGMEFGEIDNLSMALFAALGEVQNLGIGATETAQKIMDIYDNFESINSLKMQDKSFNILVNFLMNGIPIYNTAPFYNLFGIGGVNLNKPLDITAKHGGSFIGMQHGGIVSPGFSNDGMSVNVSSGERLDVTPAGNKTIDTENLRPLISELLYVMRGLPRDIKDAVQGII